MNANDPLSLNNVNINTISSTLWSLFSGDNVYIREMILVVATMLGFFISMKQRKIHLKLSLPLLFILGTISYIICQMSY